MGQVTAADLLAAIDQFPGKNADLQAKLHDLMIIYEAFETQMLGKYVENTDLLNQLADYLDNTGRPQPRPFLPRGLFTIKRAGTATGGRFD